MSFLRAVKGCTRHDRLRNEDIRDELGIEAIQDNFSNNRENWFGPTKSENTYN
jgi:hypothetical protein